MLEWLVAFRVAGRRRNMLNLKDIVILCPASKPRKPILASPLRLFCAYPRQGYKRDLEKFS